MMNKEQAQIRMNPEDRPPVTVVGLGPMGRALAGAFLRSGHPVTVWNRTAGKAGELVAQGAFLADSLTAAVSASPLVIVCVLDYHVVRTLLGPEAQALGGRTLVNLTADTPSRSREMAAWAAGHGIDYLDGAIMTPTPTIGSPAAVVLYSGPEAVYEASRPALAAIGGSASYLGTDPGRAAAYDVALLDVFWTAMSGYTHALALARAERIAPREFAAYAKGIAAILPEIMEYMAAFVEEGHHPGDASNLSSAAAGMDHIIQASEDHGMEAGVMKAARALVQRALDAGHGNDGFSWLTGLLEKDSV
ncbi:3-hydroxyisobutyrate dehydrogenase-like beta-hydroxyacid dehydrogenase [Paenibacillus mucilaginosus]|uniref:NAD(P)-dependent oxidoreductase n=1 Tax=Paenibacillus mucilaginosus TaxID=61624 RepID=UPI003D1F64FF